jgi:hypothetical protein
MFKPEISIRNRKSKVSLEFSDYDDASSYLKRIGIGPIPYEDRHPGFYMYEDYIVISLDIPGMIGLPESDYDDEKDMLQYINMNDCETLILINFGDKPRERFYFMKKLRDGSKSIKRLFDYRVQYGIVTNEIYRILYFDNRYWSYSDIESLLKKERAL